MKRGFKTWAERKALEMRRVCGLPPMSQLPARQLIAQLGVPLFVPTDIPNFPKESAQKLLLQFGDHWSAVTLVVEGKPLIIYNCSHLPERQESDLMHECAHLICDHKPGQIEAPGRLPWASRTFDAEQEEQAAWMGGCLQIPRDALLRLVQRRYDNEAIASHFGASLEMVRFRRNITGVDRQRAYWS